MKLSPELDAPEEYREALCPECESVEVDTYLDDDGYCQAEYCPACAGYMLDDDEVESRG